MRELYIKKAEHWRTDAFKLRCWRRLLRVPWTARRSNRSILKEISPEYSLEGLILKVNLQYFGPLMQRSGLLENTLMLGLIEGRRRRGWHRMRWLDVIIYSVDMNLSNFRSWWRTGKPCVLQSMVSQRVWHDWATELNFFLVQLLHPYTTTGKTIALTIRTFIGKVKVKVKLLSRVQLFATPWTAAYQAPPSMRYSRQEYWSGLPLPSPTVEA